MIQPNMPKVIPARLYWIGAESLGFALHHTDTGHIGYADAMCANWLVMLSF
jgi:hypothetical protein